MADGFKQITVRFPLGLWRDVEPKMRRGQGNEYIVEAVRRRVADEAQAAALDRLADIRRRGRRSPSGDDDAQTLVRTLRNEREAPK